MSEIFRPQESFMRSEKPQTEPVKLYHEDSTPGNKRRHVDNISRLDNQFYHGTFFRKGVGQRKQK